MQITARKRILSIFTAIALVFVLLPTSVLNVSASSIDASITSIAAKPMDLEDPTLDISNLNLAKQTSIGFSLGISNFIWDGTPNLEHYTSMVNILRENNITATVTKVQGEGFTCTPIFYESYSNKIKLSFQITYDFPGWETRPFEFTVGLAQNGVEKSETQVTIKGVAYDKNKIIHVDSGDDYVYLQDDECVIADEDIEQIRVNFEGANESVILTTSMKAGETYYGKVDDTPSSADLQVMSQHPQITDVRRLYVSDNLKTSVVRFDDIGENY